MPPDVEVARALLHQGAFGFGLSTVAAVFCSWGIRSDIHLGWEVQVSNGNFLVLMSFCVGECGCDFVLFVTGVCFLCEIHVGVKTRVDANGITLLVLCHLIDWGQVV